MAARGVALALAAIVAACGKEERAPFAWTRLAQGLRPAGAAPGESVDGAWRTTLGRFTGDALPLVAGTPCSLALDAAPASVLTFTFAALHEPGGTTPARLAVTLDGRSLLATELAPDRRAEEHALDLPAEGVRGGKLEFLLENAERGAVFQPTVGPRAARDVARGERPQPDVVLLLVDTLRADVLATYGGTGELAPGLDRLAERSVRFECRSTATWTLPAVSSVMTGNTPPQHGAYGADLALGASADTLAEVLAARGYRTAAITDSIFVSARHGVDQGFQLFEEMPEDDWDLTHTLARALEIIGEDDGRPLFLFVHTYRVHKPYRTGPEEDLGPYEAAIADTGTRADAPTKKALTQRVLAEADTYRALYERGVSALDAELAPWLERLVQTGVLERGLFVFTSDHGESFGEHGEIWHRGHPFDVQIRVPLFFHSAHLEPRAASTLASLVDVPRTVAAWCGGDAPASWGGEELLHATGPGRAFAFRLGNFVRPDGGRPSEAALLEGRRKVLATFDLGTNTAPVLRAAYDVAQDPAEERELVRAGEAWPAELLQQLAPEFARIVEPRVTAGAVELDADAREQLDGLGYAGDDEH